MSAFLFKNKMKRKKKPRYLKCYNIITVRIMYSDDISWTKMLFGTLIVSCLVGMGKKKN